MRDDDSTETEGEAPVPPSEPPPPEEHHDGMNHADPPPTLTTPDAASGTRPITLWERIKHKLGF
jgi:hypothetical protein